MVRNSREVNQRRRDVAAASKSEYTREMTEEERKLRDSQWGRANPDTTLRGTR